MEEAYAALVGPVAARAVVIVRSLPVVSFADSPGRKWSANWSGAETSTANFY